MLLDPTASSVNSEVEIIKNKFEKMCEEESLQCGICLESYKDPRIITVCLHAFCKNCLVQLNQNNCPQCREPFTASHIKRDFDKQNRIDRLWKQCVDEQKNEGKEESSSSSSSSASSAASQASLPHLRWDAELEGVLSGLVERAHIALLEFTDSLSLDIKPFTALAIWLFGDNEINKGNFLKMILDSSYGRIIISKIIKSDNGEFNQGKIEGMQAIEEALNLGEMPIQRPNIVYDFYRLKGYIAESQTKIYQRKSIVCSLVDTPNPHDRLNQEFFRSSEILSISKILKEHHLSEFRDAMFRISISQNHKYVLQQSTLQNADEACCAMLLLDYQKVVPFHLFAQGIGDWSSLCKGIKGMLNDAGLSLIERRVAEIGKEQFLRSMRELLLEKGSAILHFRSSVRQKIMLCDYIAEDLQSVRIRDPWHGWEITVQADAFIALFLVRGTQMTYYAAMEQVEEPLPSQSRNSLIELII